MPAPSRAQIKINALQRLTKEHQLYVKELEQFQAKLADQGAAADAYEAKKTTELAAETSRVLASIETRIKTEIAQVKELASNDEVAEKVPSAVKAAEDYLATLH